MAHAAVSVQPAMMVSANLVTDWKSGVFDCFQDMDICCFGCFCPGFLMCKTSEEFGECHCLPLLELCCGCLFHPVTLAMRSSMRERFRIKGSIRDDCFTVCCCPVCVWCQMARELKARRKPLVMVNSAVNVVQQPIQIAGQPIQVASKPIQVASQPIQVASLNPTFRAY